MSLLLVPNATTTPGNDANFAALVTRDAKSYLGAGGSVSIFRLTNWDSGATRPEVALGTLIDIDGSLYLADADTAIVDEGGLSDGIVYLKMVVAGGGSSVVPTFTNTAPPDYDAEKIGWYTGTDRWTGHFATKAAAAFTLKAEYADQNKTEFRFAGGGKDIDGDLTAVNGIFSGAVSAGNTGIKWITFSGTTDGNGDASIVHGLVSSNILGLVGSVRRGPATDDYRIIGSTSGGLTVNALFGSVSIAISRVGTGGENSPFRIAVYYI